MSSLRQTVSYPPAADHREAVAACFGRDRRTGERRSNTIPSESRDARLRFAAQAAGFGTYDVDCATGDSAWSPEIRLIAGLQPSTEPLSTEQVDSLIHPDDRQDFLDKLRASLDPLGSGEFEGEHRLVRPDGSIRRVKTKGRTFFVGDGRDRRPLAATGVVMDVTASRAAEQALAESRQELDKLAEDLRRSKENLELAIRGASIGTWHWNMRTGEVEFSERCRELFNIRLDEALTYERAIASFHPDDRESVMAAHHRALEQGEEYHIEKRLLWSDGSIHWIQCIGRDLYDESTGEAIGMRGVTIEVTARKVYEELLKHSNEDLESRVAQRTADLTKANEALAQSNLELQKFAYIAAHDLQTPLRSISGFAELLQQNYRGRFDRQADAWLDTLVRSAHRMHELIKDLLRYSRVDSQGKTFEATDFNLLCRDVLETLDGAVCASGACVTHGELPVVRGDRTQLGQLLQNLIDNGLKYHGDEPPRIHVSALHQGDEWLFSVRDNGIGIAGKYQEGVFDIFRRLHTQEKYPGTGIGLAVCRRVVHRHGGRIWVESEPGRGSTFYFTLPDSGD